MKRRWFSFGVRAILKNDMKVTTLKKVTIIHTSFISVDTLTGLFSELAPEVEVHHIVDDSMLPEIMAAGGVTSGVIKRFCAYAV